MKVILLDIHWNKPFKFIFNKHKRETSYLDFPSTFRKADNIVNRTCLLGHDPTSHRDLNLSLFTYIFVVVFNLFFNKQFLYSMLICRTTIASLQIF